MIKNNLLLKKVLLSFIVIAWLTIIFFFSASPANISNRTSQKTINNFFETTLEKTNNLGITNKHPSENKLKEIVLNFNKPFRKFMHAFVYFVLAILILIFLKNCSLANWKVYLLCFFLCFIFGLFDEYHQTFVVGRTGQLSDVLIDFIGGSLGILSYFIVSRIFIKRKIN